MHSKNLYKYLRLFIIYIVWTYKLLKCVSIQFVIFYPDNFKVCSSAIRLLN